MCEHIGLDALLQRCLRYTRNPKGPSIKEVSLTRKISKRKCATFEQSSTNWGISDRRNPVRNNILRLSCDCLMSGVRTTQRESPSSNDDADEARSTTEPPDEPILNLISNNETATPNNETATPHDILQSVGGPGRIFHNKKLSEENGLVASESGSNSLKHEPRFCLVRCPVFVCGFLPVIFELRAPLQPTILLVLWTDVPTFPFIVPTIRLLARSIPVRPVPFLH